MSIALKYNSRSVRLSLELMDDIRDGSYRESDFLPSELSLAQKYNVSRPTIHRAIEMLHRNGYLIKIPRRGVQVKKSALVHYSGGESRSVQTERKLTIAVIGGEVPMNYSIIKRIEGIRKYGEQHNIHIIESVSIKHEEAVDALSHLRDYSADGVFVFPHNDDRYIRVLRQLTDQQVPMVLTESLKGVSAGVVQSNDSIGVYRAIHYLIDKYHKPVYSLVSSPDINDAPDRYVAYVNAMNDAGFGEMVPECTMYIHREDNAPAYWESGRGWMRGYLAADRLFSKIKTPACIFCENDITAQGCYKAAGKYHMEIGKDVFIVGVDDLPLANLLSPKLTTLKQDFEALGFEGAKLLHQIISNKKNKPMQIRLPMELVIRESA